MSQQEIILTTSDGAPIEATLHRPAGNANAAVVDLHGGAWTSGDRTMNAAIADHLCANGIAVLSIEFRMPPAVVYPATLRDITPGILWLKEHAPELGCHSDDIGILGSSSGGHLALLAALRPSDPRYAGAAGANTPAGHVAFAVVCWPVSDPVARYAMVREKGMQKLVDAHVAFWGDEVQMLDGSPYHLVQRGDAEHLPPLLIIQGTADENLTADMQHRFVDAYRAKGGTVELTIFPDEVHGFIGRDKTSQASRAALDRIAAFISDSVSLAERSRA